MQAVADAAVEIEAAALRMLGAREHSRHELRRKLLSRQQNASTLVDEVLDDLERRDLLSDRRFAETFVDQRSRKGFGPLRIRAELQERGIDSNLVAEWLDHGPIDWTERLVDAAAHKFGTAPAGDRRALARRGRFLEQRGFPISLIRRYLDQQRDF